MNESLHLWAIPLLPLIGAAINGLLGRGFSKRAVATVGLGFSGAALVWALYVAARFGSLERIPYPETYAPWIRAGDFVANFSLSLDQLSLVMMLVVTGVGFLIHIYSVAYMAEEGGYYRFFSYLNLFMFFMLTLVLADNYLLMFVGWEGVGLASYLLIGFFFTKDSAAAAGKKAFIVNRIGDFGFLLGMFLLVVNFGTLNFGELTAALKDIQPEASFGPLALIAILLMVGAAGKSAQVPLYVWLPDAMEGPTPVSALIHAATMVTAGVYMVARSSFLFDRAPDALTVVAVVGCVTAIFAATMGMAQTDIKRVLAYSTISQLGYMFLACGVAAYAAGIFHLMTHAFFKALLFLGAGSVIHALGGEQDMRRMGGLRTKIPWTFWTMTAGTFAIAGIPPLAGFFSKDEILWWAYASRGHGHWLLWALGLTTAFLTAFYMFRLWFLTFFGASRAAEHESAHGHGHAHESPWTMLAPLVILAVLSVVGGFVGVPHALGGHNQFGAFLEPVLGHPDAIMEVHSAINLERTIALVSIVAAGAGFLVALLLYWRRPELPSRIAAALGGLYTTVRDKYYVDEAYQAVFVKPLIDGSRTILWRGVDVATIDGAVNGLVRVSRSLSGTVRRMQSGNIRSYAAWVALGAAAVLAYMLFGGGR